MSQSYLGSQELIRGNSFTFYIFKLGSNTFESPFAWSKTLNMNKMLLVLNVVKNMLSFPQFVKDIVVVF